MTLHNHHDHAAPGASNACGGHGPSPADVAQVSTADVAECPVMIGATVVKAQAEEAGLYRDYHGQRYWLCCDTCSALFDANPAEYASPSGAATRPELTTTEDTTMDLTPPPRHLNRRMPHHPRLHHRQEAVPSPPQTH